MSAAINPISPFSRNRCVTATGIGVARASDHRDNPLVEVNPAMHMTDVCAFPGSSADRLALVRLTTRRDVYGYDLLAWAQHKRGRDREAAVAMTVALSQGTQDPQLFYHASEIERSLGHRDAATALLSRAQSLNSSADGARLATR